MRWRLKSPTSRLLTVCSGADQKKTSKFCVTGLCEGNSLVIGEFPAQRASNAGNVKHWCVIMHRGHELIRIGMEALTRSKQVSIPSTIFMMTSSNGNIFRVTGPLCGEFTGDHKGQWRGVLIFSLIYARIKGLSKQSWSWWFETPSRSLWRHRNVVQILNLMKIVNAVVWTDYIQIVWLFWHEYNSVVRKFRIELRVPICYVAAMYFLYI